MIIGISGKIGSGKDLTGEIIQALIDKPDCFDHKESYTAEEISYKVWDIPKFEVKKFADKLKDIVCLLLNCTKEQLEDREFKEKELGEEWWYFSYGNGTLKIPYLEAANKLDKKVQQYLVKFTPRLLLQLVGTEAGRDIIHPNIWVNALFSEYKLNNTIKSLFEKGNEDLKAEYPNWIITDMRFPNELKAVKDRGGISIRVNRMLEWEKAYREKLNKEIPNGAHSIEIGNSKVYTGKEGKINFEIALLKEVKSISEHPSETALDNAKFDYTIDNNDTIKELIEKIKVILKTENLI